MVVVMGGRAHAHHMVWAVTVGNMARKGVTRGSGTAGDHMVGVVGGAKEGALTEAATSGQNQSSQ